MPAAGYADSTQIELSKDGISDCAFKFPVQLCREAKSGRGEREGKEARRKQALQRKVRKGNQAKKRRRLAVGAEARGGEGRETSKEANTGLHGGSAKTRHHVQSKGPEPKIHKTVKMTGPPTYPRR